jgi:anti-sigma factor RsiW
VSCEEAYEWMQRDLDGELEPFEHAKLTKHLEECADCASLYERLHTLSTHLAQLPMVEPPFSIVQSILPQLEQIDRERETPPFIQEQAATAEGIGKKSRKAIWYRYIGGATAAGLLISAVMFTLDEPQMKQSAFSPAQTTLVKDVTREKEQNVSPESVSETHAAPQESVQSQPNASADSQPSVSDETVERPNDKDSDASSRPNSGSSVAYSLQPQPNISSSKSAVKQPDRPPVLQPQGEKQESMNETASVPPDVQGEPVQPAAEPEKQPEESSVALAKGPDTSEENKVAAAVPSVGERTGIMGFAQDSSNEKQKVEDAPAKQEIAKSEGDTYKPPGKPSPGKQYFVSKSGNRLLVRDDAGNIQFVTHSWNDMYNVSYRWVDDAKISYKLTYSPRAGTENESTVHSQEWLIDLEKNIERPLFNK